YGLLEVTGNDARSFLHSQLTNDIAGLAPDRARHAGWCSAKGRLLASFLVVPREGGYFLQLARDLAPAVAKRLALFILRSQVKISDASSDWVQLGLWGDGAEAALGDLGIASPTQDLQITRNEHLLAVRVSSQRHLLFARAAERARFAALPSRSDEGNWTLEEIRSGRPLVTRATQDQFVPQMVNYDRFGAVDFQKGCYPGQEIVARAQYRGQVKRRMVRVRTPVPLQPGQELYSDDLPGQPSGTVVNAAGGEALAVVQISTLENGVAVRAKSDGVALDVLPLPYPA
ncbi:MAG: YgfZ/GcvT domain-containing protein, partial [Burkholderiales bacterium]